MLRKGVFRLFLGLFRTWALKQPHHTSRCSPLIRSTRLPGNPLFARTVKEDWKHRGKTCFGKLPPKILEHLILATPIPSFY